MVFYTYMWLREDGTPYYIGKGSGNRAFTGYHVCTPPANPLHILKQEFPDEETAFAAEKFLISFYGRKDLSTGVLRNLTDGGEGPSGAKRSEETRALMSAAAMGHKRNVGRKRSAAECQAISERQRGIVLPHMPGNKHALGKRWKLSEDTKRNISLSKTGNKSKLGLRDSLETLERKSTALKLFHNTESAKEELKTRARENNGRWARKEDLCQ